MAYAFQMLISVAVAAGLAFLAVRQPRAFRFLGVLLITSVIFGIVVSFLVPSPAPSEPPDVAEFFSVSIPVGALKAFTVWFIALLVALADAHRCSLEHRSSTPQSQ